MQAMFSPIMSLDCTRVFQILAVFRPDIVIPPLLERSGIGRYSSRILKRIFLQHEQFFVGFIRPLTVLQSHTSTLWFLNALKV